MTGSRPLAGKITSWLVITLWVRMRWETLRSRKLSLETSNHVSLTWNPTWAKMCRRSEHRQRGRNATQSLRPSVPLLPLAKQRYRWAALLATFSQNWRAAQTWIQLNHWWSAQPHRSGFGPNNFTSVETQRGWLWACRYASNRHPLQSEASSRCSWWRGRSHRRSPPPWLQPWWTLKAIIN